MKALDITGDPFHPEWNYTIKPQCSEKPKQSSLRVSSVHLVLKSA